MGMSFVAFSIFFLSINAFYVQRRSNSSQTTQLQLIETKVPLYIAQDIADDLTQKLQEYFYQEDVGNWQNSCQNGGDPLLWQVAVASHSIRSDDEQLTERALTALANYRNSTGGYSASTAKNGEIYNDDDAQVQWGFMDAYQLENNITLLEEATNLTDFILSYQHDEGGIRWSINGDYISLISSLEGALASLRLHEVNGETKYLDVAKQSINWVLDTLVDSSDGFIMDGETINGDINGGKLTYTIGTLLSSCAYLTKIGDKEKDWKALAIDYGVRLTAGGKLENQFFSDGYINDIIERSHLAYVGVADLLTLTNPSDNYQKEAYDVFKQFLVREARHYKDTYNTTINSSQCPEDDFQHLLKFSSLIQVFVAASRVTNMI